MKKKIIFGEPVGDSLGFSVNDLVWNPVLTSVFYSVGELVRDSVYDLVARPNQPERWRIEL